MLATAHPRGHHIAAEVFAAGPAVRHFAGVGVVFELVAVDRILGDFFRQRLARTLAARVGLAGFVGAGLVGLRRVDAVERYQLTV